MLVAGDPRGGFVVVQLVFLHREQEGQMAVVRLCCTRLHSLLARVSLMFPGALAGIDSYQDLETDALELLQHARVVESRRSAAAWR